MPGVYISYPFCAQKCTYCNFASGVLPRELEPKYLASLRAEIQKTKWAWAPETVFLGGGTPSLIDPEALESLLSMIPGRSPGSKWTEATMEAAPGSITKEKAEAWRRAGINRVSLGVQSFVTAGTRPNGPQTHGGDRRTGDRPAARNGHRAHQSRPDCRTAIANGTRVGGRRLDCVERFRCPARFRLHAGDRRGFAAGTGADRGRPALRRGRCTE